MDIFMDDKKHRKLRTDDKMGSIIVYELYSKKDTVCSECKEEVKSGTFITLTKDKELLCLPCADLDHLVYLSSGNTALTTRARKHSDISAIVLRWKPSRKQYWRIGILVQEKALERAEEECLSDAEVREKKKNREAIRRKKLDEEYIKNYAQRIRELYPGCPSDEEFIIAEHACLKHSGRVGRSISAKNLDEPAVILAIIAHIRHTMTNYDQLLACGYDRRYARELIKPKVDEILAEWDKK
jgi:hypothetical protein